MMWCPIYPVNSKFLNERGARLIRKPVTFGTMVSICSASVPSPHFEIIVLVRDVLRRYTYRVWISSHIRVRNGYIIRISQRACEVLLVYYISLSWKTPHFWNVQVVFPLLRHPSLQTHNRLETICTFSVLVYPGSVSGHPVMFLIMLGYSLLCVHTVTHH